MSGEKPNFLFDAPLFVTVLARLIINVMMRMFYPFLPAFSRGLGVPIEHLIRLLSLRSALAMSAPFFGRLPDRFGRRNIMFAAMIILAAALAAMALWPGHPFFVVVLLLGMVAQFLFLPAQQAYLSERVPYVQRGRVIAIGELAWSGALLLGIPVVGWLLARAATPEAGLPRPFAVLAVVSLAVAGLLLRALPRETVRHGRSSAAFFHWKPILTNPHVLAGLALGLLIGGANESLNVAFAAWLEGSFGLALTALGLATGIIGAAELLGEGGVMVISDRLGKRRTIALGVGLSTLAYLALPALGSTLPGALIGLFLVYLTFEFAFVATLPLMTELVPLARTSVMSANFAGLSLGRMLGALLGGALLPFGIGASGITAAGINIVALAVLLLWVRENDSRDGE